MIEEALAIEGMGLSGKKGEGNAKFLQKQEPNGVIGGNADKEDPISDEDIEDDDPDVKMQKQNEYLRCSLKSLKHRPLPLHSERLKAAVAVECRKDIIKKLLQLCRNKKSCKRCGGYECKTV